MKHLRTAGAIVALCVVVASIVLQLQVRIEADEPEATPEVIHTRERTGPGRRDPTSCPLSTIPLGIVFGLGVAFATKGGRK